MIIDVIEGGNYRINFKKQKRLKVWRCKLPFLSRLFQQPIQHHLLQILDKNKDLFLEKPT